MGPAASMWAEPLARYNATLATAPLQRYSVVGLPALLWGRKAGKGTDIGYRSSAAPTMVNHLANCLRVAPEIRKLAQEDRSCTLVEFQGERERKAAAHPYPDSSLGPGPSSSNIRAPGPAYPPQHLGLLLSHGENFSESPPGSAALSPLIMAGLNTPGSASAESGQGSPTVFATSANPNDTASAVFSRLGSLSRSTSRGRFTPSGHVSSSPGIASGPGAYPESQAWTRERQASFEKRIARLTVSANLPLSWVDNPKWIEFCREFIPGARSPSRKVLTSRIIPDLVLEIRQAAKIEVQGKNVTLQSDGWTGGNHRHLIAFMITTEKKVYTVRVHDASTERKTAENLKILLDEVVKELEEEWKTSVIAVVTDASGECRKARRQFLREHPWMAVLDCFAHQINLVVGDYFKAESPLLIYTDQANDLITWLRSKTILLNTLREKQESLGQRVLTILWAILTRWTMHLRAYEHLLLVLQPLRLIVLEDMARVNENQKVVITGDAKAKAKARQMCTIIQSDLFWQSLARVVHHLRPLGIAANIIQSAFCRLDMVILTFGSLVYEYKQMTDPDDIPGCTAILNSIKKRWSKTDQELFIGALVVNPIYRQEPLAHLPHFTNTSIISLLGRLWKRFNRANQVPDQFKVEAGEYLSSEGLFHNLNEMIHIERNKAKESEPVCAPDPINILRGYGHGQSFGPFVTFAMRLLMINANSASCERLFSVYGAILTDKRNRLLLNNMKNQADLKAQIRDEHLKSDTAKKRLHERFVSHKQSSRAAEKAPATRGADSGTDTARSQVPGGSNTSQSARRPVSLIEDSRQMEVDGTQEPAALSQPANTLWNFAEIQQRRATDDDTDSDPLFSPNTIPRAASENTSHPTPSTTAGPGTSGPTPSTATLSSSQVEMRLPLLPIATIFNFENTYWKRTFDSMTILTFDQELDLFELLDLDADGEDAGVDVDESTGEVLLG